MSQDIYRNRSDIVSMWTQLILPSFAGALLTGIRHTSNMPVSGTQQREAESIQSVRRRLKQTFREQAALQKDVSTSAVLRREALVLTSEQASLLARVEAHAMANGVSFCVGPSSLFSQFIGTCERLGLPKQDWENLRPPLARLFEKEWHSECRFELPEFEHRRILTGNSGYGKQSRLPRSR